MENVITKGEEGVKHRNYFIYAPYKSFMSKERYYLTKT
jgi:hypothetical protein